MIRAGALRATFYCPGNAGFNNDKVWDADKWFGGNNPPLRRITGYIWYMPGCGGQPASYSGMAPYWQTNIAGTTHPPSKSVVCTDINGYDITTLSYVEFSGGWLTPLAAIGCYQRNNHLTPAGLPAGSCQVYLDGHVAWYLVTKFATTGIVSPLNPINSTLPGPIWKGFGPGTANTPEFFLWNEW